MNTRPSLTRTDDRTRTEEAAVIQVALVRFLNYQDPRDLATIAQALHTLTEMHDPHRTACARITRHNGQLIEPYAGAATELTEELQ